MIEEILNNDKIKSIKYKVCDLILISILLSICLVKKIEFKTISLEEELKKYFCKIFIFEKEYNCLEEIYNNVNFFDDAKSIKKHINPLITEKKTKIENLLLLIVTIPFIKDGSKLKYKINEDKLHLIFPVIFGNKINNNIIIIQKRDISNKNIKSNLINLLNCEWELIPSRHILDIVRYVINHYYENSCLNTFDNSLNLNFKNYIRINQNNFTPDKKSDLISKKYNLISLKYYFRKYWNL